MAERKIVFVDRLGREYSTQPGRKQQSVKDRFWSRVEVQNEPCEYRPDLGPCWLWTGRPAPSGYASLWYQGRYWRVNRLAVHLFVAELPDDLTVDHLCFVKLCVNYEKHLEVATSGDNTRRFHPDGRYHIIGRGRK